MARKRLILRRNLTLDPPRSYHYKWEMTRQQYIFHEYRIECALRTLSHRGENSNDMLGDAGYCLDSQVDSVHLTRDYISFEKVNKPSPVIGPAAAFVGGNRSTRPRDPNYVMGSFGGNRGRAERNRF